MNEILKLHDYEKDSHCVEVTQFCHGGKDVIRKLEIAKEIAKESNIKCVGVRAKNSIVYAAVCAKDDEEQNVTARIYDTHVFKNGDRTYMSYKIYDEADYLPLDEYERFKERLESYDDDSREKERLINRLNNERRYVLPTTCHASILRKLTPTAKTNVNRWREDCRSVLEGKAVEKTCPDSLTNLPILARIKLMQIHSDGSPIVLVKDTEGKYKHPIWIDDFTGEKYPIKKIQEMGFEIISRE